MEFVPLDTKSVEDLYRLGPADFLTAEKIFDARWAITLLDEAMDRLRQEYAAQGKTSVFETLKPYLDPINSEAPPPYEHVANALQVSVASVKTLIHRLRKRYACLLREEVARTVCDPGEIDEEIHSLCEALIAAEGRLGP
jgi:RNA polymerase sigma-70 factor (ECF subfamily)